MGMSIIDDGDGLSQVKVKPKTMIKVNFKRKHVVQFITMAKLQKNYILLYFVP